MSVFPLLFLLFIHASETLLCFSSFFHSFNHFSLCDSHPPFHTFHGTCHYPSSVTLPIHALWWHGLPLLSGSSPSPRLQVKSILTHRPQGPNWTVTEFLQPRWAPTTRLRINGWGARTGQKNQCLFIQTWQSRRPSNSPACFSRRSAILWLYFFFFLSFYLPRIKCSPSGEDRTAGDALWPFCPQFVLTMCRSVAWGATECTNCHAKPSRSCWADALQTGEVTGSSRTLFFSWGVTSVQPTQIDRVTQQTCSCWNYCKHIL